MKRRMFFFVLLVALFIGILPAQNSISGREFTIEEEDTTYVMKKYFLCIYIAGPNRGQSSEEALDLQVAHIEHNSKLTKAGKVLLSGPLDTGANGRMRGILVFDTATQAEAEELVCQDPMVRVSRLDFEMIPWWAAKGTCLY